MTALPDLTDLSDQEAQAVLEMVHRANKGSWRPFYCPNRQCDGEPHNDGSKWTYRHARVKQRPPPWDDPWLALIVKSGRGFGKTEMGSRITHEVAKRAPFLALVAPTGPGIRETMVEGPTGILATAKPDFMPIWEPSRKRLVWPNGAVGLGLSAEEPERIRSLNLAFAWLDEASFFENIERVWSNLMFALRVKDGLDGRPIRNHVLITTTPVPSKWIKERINDPKNIVVSGSTYENIQNLAPEFRDQVLSEHEGTRLGRQEIYGEVLEDVEGALWTPAMFQHIKQARVPDLDRIIVSVDPAGSANARSDETGIIVEGRKGRDLYVLGDFTGKYSPAGWAELAHKVHRDFSADAIVAEKNYGGDMVKHTLESVSSDARVILVDSRRGKQIRAEPVVGYYEKKMVWHVREADLSMLETEQCEWVPGKGASPNRVDAMVHGAVDLMQGISGPASVADPNKLLEGYVMPTNDYRTRNMRGLM